MEGKYNPGRKAVKRMRNILFETLWLEQALGRYGRGLEEIRAEYSLARDTALRFGEDILKFPRRINWKTNHQLVA